VSRGTGVADEDDLRRESVVGLVQRLVRIPSPNPPGDTGAVCRVLAEVLKPTGFEIELFEPEEGFVSLLASRSYGPPGPTLVFCGHVDVVPASGSWSRDPWGGELVDGEIYGRGSLDMKGPLAALVVAARDLPVPGQHLCGRLVVAAVADEEQGGRQGAGALLAAGKIDADAVVIAEPGDGAVVVAHRGMCFVEITTKGRSTHASMPSEGVNAVELMVDILAACRSLELRHRRHALLCSPTVAIGTTISGGDKINVIPDSCRATLDVRKVPGMTDEGVVREITAHLGHLGFRTPKHFVLEVIRSGEPGETDPDAEIVQTAVRAFEREFAQEPEVRGTVAATDGWWFTKAGIPTVMALGPGGIADCHIIDEHIDVEELSRYVNVYRQIAGEFLSSDPVND
jgi:succinyl-diaminopimelate desuccinylase